MKIQKGFTLLELMIVLAVLGIIVAMALPMYDRYRERAYRTEVRAALELVSQKMQETYAQTRRYGCLKEATNGGGDCVSKAQPDDIAGWLMGLGSSRISVKDATNNPPVSGVFWEIDMQLMKDNAECTTAMEDCTGYSVTATATTVGDKRLSTCKWYGINERNIKVANSTPASAWGTPRSPVSRECWNR